MTADRRAALVERVALIEKLANDLAAQPGGRTARMCEIDRLIDLIRAETLEEAARVADKSGAGLAGHRIRALAAPSGAMKGD